MLRGKPTIVGHPTIARRPGVVRSVIGGFADRDLLSYASALAFQVLFALIPLVLAAFALLGLVGLAEVWSDQLAPQVRAAVPDDAFAVLDHSARRIIGEQRTLWLTFGMAFAVWQVSSAVRAASGPLNVVYGFEDDRPVRERMRTSLALGLAITPLFVVAVGGIAFGDELIEALELGPLAGLAAALARWAITALVLLTIVWLVLRFAPAGRPAVHYVSIGSALVVGGWIVASLCYLAYLENVAQYGTAFGGLATVFVLMSYLYLLAVVFLAGIQVDALVRERLGGTSSSHAA